MPLTSIFKRELLIVFLKVEPGKRRIQELIAFRGGGYNEDNVADIIENALKLLKDSYNFV